MDSKKIVLISGSSSGMGKQTAIFLEKHGYIVYAGSRNPEKLDNLKTKNIKVKDIMVQPVQTVHLFDSMETVMNKFEKTIIINRILHV